MNPEVILGANCCFDRFSDFEKALQSLENAQNAVFVKKSSKKLLGTSDPSLSTEMLYESILYECKHGTGRKSQSKGIRVNQKTVKLGCTAKIRVKLVQVNGCWKLKVVQSKLTHENHDQSKEVHRKIIMTPVIETLLRCPSVSNSDLRDFVFKEQGIAAKTKDISNLRLRIRSSQKGTDLEETDKILKSIVDRGGRVDLGLDDNREFECFAYMTEKMIETLNKFPKVLVIDITCNTNIYNLPLLTILAVDSNRRVHPVLHCFLNWEKQHLLVRCLQFFKASYSFANPCFFIDKDFSKSGTISEVFSDAYVMFHAFHAHLEIQKPLSEKGLTAEVIESITALFSTMKDAVSLAEYQAAKEEILTIAPADVVQYFESNWWNRPEVWAHHLNLETVSLCVITTKHCESYRTKVTKVLNPRMLLSNCITKLIHHDDHSRRLSALSCFLNSDIPRHVSASSFTDPVIHAIDRDLTPFASEYVICQLLATEKCTFSFNLIVQGVYHVNNSYVTTYANCTCSFYKCFNLFCRHIFFLRKRDHFDLYVPVSVDNIFKNKLTSKQPLQSQGPVVSPILPPQNIDTPKAKHLLTSQLTTEILSFFPLLGDSDFQEIYRQLANLIILWRGFVTENEAMSSISETLSEPMSKFSYSDGVDLADFSEHTYACTTVSSPIVYSSDTLVHDVASVTVVSSSPIVSGGAQQCPSTPDSFSLSGLPNDPSVPQLQSKRVKIRSRLKQKQTFTTRPKKKAFYSLEEV